MRAGGAATEEARLLSLAAEQRLSTEVRKAVFVAIMGSDDYIHAFDRISKLKVKKAQKAEVVRVLMHCCGAEATFNAFYALLAARLCSAHREYKFAFHFAMWDAFKQLHDAPLNKVANTAKLLAQLLNRGALPVTVLKVVRWHDLDQRALFFWQVHVLHALNTPKNPAHTYRTPHEQQHSKRRQSVCLYPLVPVYPLAGVLLRTAEREHGCDDTDHAPTGQ